MISKNLLIGCACAFAAVVTVFAQEARKVELRLLAFGTELRTDECFAHDPAAAPTAASVEAPIQTYLNDQFATVLLTSPKVVFTSKPERESLTREDEILLDVTLPKGVKSALLLVVPGLTGDKAKFRAVVIDDSKEAFPAGSYHATNMSKVPIRLMLEKTSYDFPPGKVLLIENPPTHDGHLSAMRTFAFKDNVWGPISTGLWPKPVETRGVLIFYQDPKRGNIQLRAFDDVAPRAPLPPPAT